MQTSGGYWFEDPRDPRVARWFDGRRPTGHTLRIADLEEGVAPPPPLAAAPEPRLPKPIAPKHLKTAEAVPEFLWGAERPWWTVIRFRLIAGAAATMFVLTAVLAGQVATRGGGGSDRPELESVSLAGPAGYDQAAVAAAAVRAQLSAPNLTQSGLEELLPLACEAVAGRSPARLAGQLSRYRFTGAELAPLVRALRIGARDLCKDAVDAYRVFFDDVLPMVLVASEGYSESRSLGREIVSSGGNVATGDATVNAGPATAVGSTSSDTSSRSNSVDVVSTGSSCSVAGQTTTMRSGGAAVCSAVSCEGWATGLRWRPAACG